MVDSKEWDFDDVVLSDFKKQSRKPRPNPLISVFLLLLILLTAYLVHLWIRGDLYSSRKELGKTAVETKEWDVNPLYAPEAMEKNILAHINAERSRVGLSVLYRSPQLDFIAREYSINMGEEEFFDHFDPDGKDVNDRADKIGFRCIKEGGIYSTVGENLYMGSLYEEYTIRNNRRQYLWHGQEDLELKIAQGWIGSAMHYENIKHPDYEITGVGVYITAELVYVTQVFC
jgi:uncharacterized protein YkwD